MTFRGNGSVLRNKYFPDVFQPRQSTGTGNKTHIRLQIYCVCFLFIQERHLSIDIVCYTLENHGSKACLKITDSGTAVMKTVQHDKIIYVTEAKISVNWSSKCRKSDFRSYFQLKHLKRKPNKFIHMTFAIPFAPLQVYVGFVLSCAGIVENLPWIFQSSPVFY